MIEDYISRIKKVSNSKKHRISNSIGMREAFRFYTKNSKKLDEPTFRKLIKFINLSLQELLASGEDINLPQRMGRLELRKFRTKVSFIDGKLVTNLPIDWNETLKLWYEDKESERKKTKVLLETPEIFRVCYKKNTANYNNKSFFEFKTNRGLKQKLKLNIKNKKVDAFLVD